MLKHVQSLLLHAVLQPDPQGWLQEQLAHAECPLTAAERKMLASVSPDGMRLTRLLVRKLRIERLLRGDAAMAALFATDAAGFAQRFRAYEAEHPPRALFPSEEAEQFAARRHRP